MANRETQTPVGDIETSSSRPMSVQWLCENEHDPLTDYFGGWLCLEKSHQTLRRTRGLTSGTTASGLESAAAFSLRSKGLHTSSTWSCHCGRYRRIWLYDTRILLLCSVGECKLMPHPLEPLHRILYLSPVPRTAEVVSGFCGYGVDLRLK